MKFTHQLSLFIFLLLTGCSSCKKEVLDASGLPPATQTGANTFGCLINGKPFIPGNTPLFEPPVQANYQYLYGGYYFRLVGNYGKGTNNSGVGIFTDSLRLIQGDSIKFSSDSIKTVGLAYALYSKGLTDFRTKLPKYSGSLFITNLDTQNQIVSGTFWFNAITYDGSDTVSVTDGRFDVRYTR